jgi:hypothetical protein
LPPLKKTGITPRATKVSLPVGQYDEERPFFEKQRNAEYNELLEKGKLGKVRKPGFRIASLLPYHFVSHFCHLSLFFILLSISFSSDTIIFQMQ